MSRVRSNRVKSELIVRQKLTEDCFITKNHSGSGDYVTVRIVIPAEKDEAEEARLAAERAEQERIAAEQAKQQQLEQQKQEQERIAREKEQARLAAEQAKADSLAAEQAKRRNAFLPGKPKMLTATPSPCGPTCCAGPRSRPTWGWSGASARPWASW